MLKNYIKIALRNLQRHKGYSFINIAGLAVGMACCTLIMLFLQDELRYDTHHTKADRIYRVVQGDVDFLNANTVYPMAPAMVQEFPEIEQAVRFRKHAGVVLQHDDIHFVEDRFYFADSTVFEVFTFPLLQGASATALIEPNTAVITQTTARRYFGEADPMGQILTATLDDEGLVVDLTVTGVLKDLPLHSHFHFDVLASFETQPEISDDWRTYTPLYTYLLLPEKHASEALEAKFPAFIARHYNAEAKDRYQLQTLTDIHLYGGQIGAEPEPQGDIAFMYLFSAIASIILLIACINFMNLTTARSAQRAQEIGMRKTVGARRWQLVLQFQGEALLYSGLALIFALVLIQLFLPVFNDLAGKTLTMEALSTGGHPLNLVGIALFVGLVAGSYPAFFLSAFQPVAVLKGRSRPPRHAGLRRSLVVVQFAVSIVLIISTGFVFNQLDYVRAKNLGFNQEQVLVVPLSGVARQQAEVLKREVLQHPAIVEASLSERVPTAVGDFMGFFQPEGQEARALPVFFVDSAFPATYGLDIIAGRSFSPDHATDETQSILINESAVRKMGWSSMEEAVGKGLSLWGIPGQIIGVVKDFHIHSLREQIAPLVLTMGPVKERNNLSVRVRPEAVAQTLAFLQRTWQHLAPDTPFHYAFIDERFERLHDADQRLGQIFGYFALLALFIGCLGLFGLAAFTAEQHTKEIGIRKVLGASVSSVVVLLSKDFVRLVVIAFVVAAPVAYIAMQRWLDTFAYRIDTSWGVFLLAGTLALSIAVLTVSYQAIRAALADPVKALRYE